MNIHHLLTAAVTNQLTKGVSRKLGIPEENVQRAVGLAIPVLVGGIAKNSMDPQGARRLSKAISKDHDGSILQHVLSAITTDSTAEEGNKIVGHILGARQEYAVQTIADKTHIDPQQVLQLLNMVAPVVMGAIGKQQNTSGFDSIGLSSFLQNTVRQGSKSSRSAGILSRILDQNQDGRIVDDVAHIGMNVLGGLFRKK